jgi:integrase
MLNLYRRHHRHGRHQCIAGHPGDSTSYETDELRRTWKKCVCPIYVSGTLGGKFARKNTKCFAWPEAKLVMVAWIARGSWDDLPPVPPPSPDAPAKGDGRIAIAEAIEKYLAEHKASGSKELTLQSYEERTRAFARYSEKLGYYWLDQWTMSDVRDYRDSWKNSPLTRSRKLGWVRTFFNYAMGREWVNTNPAAVVRISGIGGKSQGSVRVQRSPFTGRDIELIFRACERITFPQWQNGTAGGTWTGQDLADFIAVSIYTGLRISDVVAFDVSRLKGNLIFLRQHKTGKPLLTWVPDWIRDLILSRVQVHGNRIFHQFSHTRSVKVRTNQWRKKIKQVFALAATEEPLSGGRPTPHRFRHTFVRILLEHKVSIETVAELAGDTKEIIQTHYAEWCQERQDRLTQELQAAFADQAKPRLVVSRRPG